MPTNAKTRDMDELIPGDVILCYCDPNRSMIAKAIYDATGSKYCHAAIYYGLSLAAESVVKGESKKGEIGKTSVSELVSRYEHVAVLRQPDAWISPDRVGALQLFIDRVVETQAKYNFKGVFSFKSRKDFHQANVQDKLTNFFEGKSTCASTEKAKYFCSEFVADCFIAVGFIAPSAAVLFQSDTYSPGDLGKEPAFGTFWGYLSTSNDYRIPEEDYYYCATTYDEIFGAYNNASNRTPESFAAAKPGELGGGAD